MKYVTKKTHENTTNLIIHDLYAIKGSRVLTLDKLTEIYPLLISKVQSKPSSNFYFENLFDENSIEWTAIYMPPRLATLNNYMRIFQYQLLNTFLFLDKKLRIFGIKSSLGFSSKTYKAKYLYTHFIRVILLNAHGLMESLSLTILTLQTAIFGLLDSTNSDSKFMKNKLLIDQILLIFKLYVYKSKEKLFININKLIPEIQSV